MEGGGGREKRFLHSPPPPPSFLFFALVPIFSTNSRGTACYAGYTEHSRGISYEAREACLVFSFRKSISILPSCFLFFSFPFFSKSSFAAHFLAFRMKIRLANFPGKEEILSGKSSRCKEKLAVDFFTKMLFFVSLTGSVRIFQNKVSVKIYSS